MRAGLDRRRKVTSTRRRRAAVGAWLAALTMTVIAVSPLLAMFHRISAGHAVCEHGELVESGHGGVSANNGAVAKSAWARRAADSTPPSDIRPDSEPALHGHSHCSVGTLAKNSVSLLPGAQVVARLAEVAAGGARHCEFAYIRTILLTAPKTSPPHVAS
jgi:hypothetical protein